MSVPSLTLLIGGVRAGKSARALSLASARSNGGTVLFVATAQALDDEMRARIAAHRRERSPEWETLESPVEIARDIARRRANAPVSLVVIDCLTLWVSNMLVASPADADAEAAVAERARGVVAALAGVPSVVVTNEVGLGVVPATPLGRRYRDALGRANQIVAAAADEVTLMVAGLEVRLKG